MGGDPIHTSQYALNEYGSLGLFQGNDGFIQDGWQGSVVITADGPWLAATMRVPIPAAEAAHTAALGGDPFYTRPATKSSLPNFSAVGRRRIYNYWKGLSRTKTWTALVIIPLQQPKRGAPRAPNTYPNPLSLNS